MPDSLSQKTHVRVFFDSFFSMRFVAKRYILQQKCLKGQIETCLLGTRWYNFQPCAQTLRATMHSVTDRQTDDMMMPIADHTMIGSAKNCTPNCCRKKEHCM